MRKTITACIAAVGLLNALGTLGCGTSGTPPGATSVSQPENKASSEIGYGTLLGHTYSNDYFGLSVSIPDEWYIQNREEAAEVLRIGKAVTLGQGVDPNFKAAVEASQTNTLQLLSAFRHPPGTPGLVSNPTVSIIAERVKHLPGIRSGAEYCAMLKQSLGQSAIKTESDAVLSGLKIGSLDAHCLPARMTVGTIVIQQRFYATRYKDYVLAVIVSYSADEELLTAEKILSEIKAGGK